MGGGRGNANILLASAFAPLTLFLAVLCTNTLHLKAVSVRSLRIGGTGFLVTLAARQTVQALAPRATGFELNDGDMGKRKREIREQRSIR